VEWGETRIVVTDPDLHQNRGEIAKGNVEGPGRDPAPSMPLGTRQTVCVLSETRPKSDATRPRILLGVYSGFSFYPLRSFTFFFKRGLEFPESYRGRRYIPVRENRDVAPSVSLGPRYKRISQQLFPRASESIIVCIKSRFIINFSLRSKEL